MRREDHKVNEGKAKLFEKQKIILINDVGRPPLAPSVTGYRKKLKISEYILDWYHSYLIRSDQIRSIPENHRYRSSIYLNKVIIIVWNFCVTR
jgi:hypothetical protein